MSFTAATLIGPGGHARGTAADREDRGRKRERDRIFRRFLDRCGLCPEAAGSINQPFAFPVRPGGSGPLSCLALQPGVHGIVGEALGVRIGTWLMLVGPQSRDLLAIGLPGRMPIRIVAEVVPAVDNVGELVARRFVRSCSASGSFSVPPFRYAFPLPPKGRTKPSAFPPRDKPAAFSLASTAAVLAKKSAGTQRSFHSFKAVGPMPAKFSSAACWYCRRRASGRSLFAARSAANVAEFSSRAAACSSGRCEWCSLRSSSVWPRTPSRPW